MGGLRIGACARRDLIDCGRYSLCSMTTGSLIREARLAEGLTQAQLARRLGITQPSVARLEAAGDEVTVATLQRALNVMGRALVLHAQLRPSSVDESQIRATRSGSRRASGIERHDREHAELREWANEAQAAVARVA